MDRRTPVAGVELGGTKCICTLGSGPDSILEQVRIDTRDPRSTLSDIDSVLDRWRGDHAFAAIGIASFGPLQLDRDMKNFGLIVSTTKPGWSGTPLASRFDRFGVPVGIDTDVVGAARAEQRWGAARGLEDFAYVTVGTGVGVGVIARDNPIGALGNAEMGHVRVPRLAGDDWAGSCVYHGDCVEGLASGSAIAARHGPGPVAEAWAGWASVEHALAMLVHNLVLTLQPRRIIVGGGVAAARPALLEAIMRRAVESLASFYTGGSLPSDFLVPPALGDQAGPLGALALGFEALGR